MLNSIKKELNKKLTENSASAISGASPAILKQVLSDKTGWELCLETLLSDRYRVIK